MKSLLGSQVSPGYERLIDVAFPTSVPALYKGVQALRLGSAGKAET